MGLGLGKWRRVRQRARDERVAGWVAIAVGAAVANAVVAGEDTVVRLEGQSLLEQRGYPYGADPTTRKSK